MEKRLAGGLVVGVALGLAASCGGSSTGDSEKAGSGGSGGGSSGAGGSAGSTGSGGSGGGAGSSGSAGSGGGTAGAGTDASVGQCGGKQGLQCAGDQWCDYDSACGFADQLGVCRPRPTACDADCPGVCGCDGNFYCNECVANGAGVDVADGGLESCTLDVGTGGTYTACALATALDRIVVFKRDEMRGLCFAFTLVHPASGGFPGFSVSTPPSWGVEGGWVSNEPNDCVPFPQSGAERAHATAGSGFATWPIDDAAPWQAPTSLEIDVTLTFPPDYPWVPPTERLTASGLDPTLCNG